MGALCRSSESPSHKRRICAREGQSDRQTEGIVIAVDRHVAFWNNPWGAEIRDHSTGGTFRVRRKETVARVLDAMRLNLGFTHDRNMTFRSSSTVMRGPSTFDRRRLLC